MKYLDPASSEAGRLLDSGDLLVQHYLEQTKLLEPKSQAVHECRSTVEAAKCQLARTERRGGNSDVTLARGFAYLAQTGMAHLKRIPSPYVVNDNGTYHAVDAQTLAWAIDRIDDYRASVAQTSRVR